ncbi:hypothetical protein [Morganella morganii]|uniref:Uncharacterized protein n=1 Tax=Morganella morganii TaxID=582 RepID=A0AAE4FD89_MORMO|nr:hypothetical protein [Morganella morganii]EJG2203812.1 hypothetical protein [Morganella morganii]ELN8407449.1 hypothetical protein [Morganella morganii]MBT0399973.1 hypothetical protein [Morganella morganii subsp. morganii]MBX9344980.1 hypothetical protein [Morganella morganii]MBX9369324.1 hypothetical protein [Morganella morganii]
MTLITEERAPSAQEYCTLRIKVGLSAKSLKAAEIGLPGIGGNVEEVQVTVSYSE